MLEVEVKPEYISKFKKLRVETLAQVLQANYSDEEELLCLADKNSQEVKELLLRKIFLQSRNFSLDIVKNKNSTFFTEEIVKFINLYKIPCVSGDWTKNDGGTSFQLTRNECYSPAKERNNFLCEYWKEVTDGLIMGLGESERFARHRSFRYGCNDNCVDVIYDSNYIDCRWGEVPELIKEICKPLIKNLEKIQVEIILDGFSEKTLFYTIKDKNKSLSTFRKGFLLDTVTKFFLANKPEIVLFETSPRAVIEGEF